MTYEESLHNERILRSMVRKIEEYQQAQKKHLPSLASDLDICIDSLFDYDSEMQRILREKWWVVEEINAFALAQMSTEPTKEDEEALEIVLKELLVLLRREELV